jgi:hypothetical protein
LKRFENETAPKEEPVKEKSFVFQFQPKYHEELPLEVNLAGETQLDGQEKL